MSPVFRILELYQAQMLNCAAFIYIGAWIPFSDFNIPVLGIQPWRLVVLFVAVALLRRIPALLAIYRFVPDIISWREALFCGEFKRNSPRCWTLTRSEGHFGPMGVGAVFISTLALTSLPTANNPPRNQTDYLVLAMQPIAAFMVTGSVLIRGSRRLAKN